MAEQISRFDLEMQLVEVASELTREDLANLGRFALTEQWKILAPRLTGYLAAVACTGLRADENTVRIGLEDWTTRDVADALVGCCGLFEVCISPTFDAFCHKLLRVLAVENTVRLQAAPAFAALN